MSTNLNIATMGQSNMVGSGLEGAGYVKVTYPKAYNFVSSNWVAPVDPMGGGNASMLPALINSLFDNGRDGVINIIPTAVGGIGITQVPAVSWNNDSGTTYVNAKAKIDLAGGCDCILFMAGETDIINAVSESACEAGLDLWYSNVIRDFGNIPVFMINVDDPDEPVNSLPIRAAIVSFCDKNNNVHLVGDAIGRDLEADNIHLTNSALADLGTEIGANANLLSVTGSQTAVEPNLSDIDFALLPACEADFRTVDSVDDTVTVYNNRSNISVDVGGWALGNGFLFDSKNSLYRLDGVNTSIDTNKAYTVDGSLLFSFTVTIDKGVFTGSQEPIFTNFTNSSNYFGCQISTNGSFQVFYRIDGDTPSNVTSAAGVIVANSSYEIGVRVSGVDVSLFINGFPVTTGTMTYGSSFEYTPMVMSDFAGFRLNADIKRFIVFANVLSDDEFTDYNSMPNDLGYTGVDNGDGTMRLIKTTIGDWDNTNNTFALVPSAEGSFRTIDTNTGFANLYNGPSAGGVITGIMTNMTTGYGFIYNNGVPYYLGDGINDAILTTDFTPVVSNDNEWTVIVAFKYIKNSAWQHIVSQTIDLNNTFFVGIGGNEDAYIAIYESGFRGRATSTTTLVDGQSYIIEYSQSGAQFSIMINGVKETLVNDLPVTSVANTYPAIELLGTAGGEYGGLIGECYGIWYYDVARSESDALAFYNLGSDLGGLFGIDNGNGTMSLVTSPPIGKNRIPTSTRIGCKAGYIY